MSRWQGTLLASLGAMTILSFSYQGLLGLEMEREELYKPTPEQEQRAALRDEFLTKMDAWLGEIKTGELSLGQAAEAIRAYCRESYPWYLEQLPLVEKGATMEEKIARNLLRHFEMAPQPCPDVVVRLRLEMEEWGADVCRLDP